MSPTDVTRRRFLRRAAAAPGPAAAGTPVAGRTELARTGADLHELTVAGLAAVAGGAALKLWSADLERAAAKGSDPPYAPQHRRR